MSSTIIISVLRRSSCFIRISLRPKAFTATRFAEVIGVCISAMHSTCTNMTQGIHFSVSSRRTIGSATADIPTIAGKITNSPIVCARLSIARTCFLSSCACAMTGNMTDCTAVSRLRDTVVEKRCPRS